MENEPIDVNSRTYPGIATASTGSAAVSPALLPYFDEVERIVVQNLSTVPFAIKTGDSSVTVSYPTFETTASELTIVPPGAIISVKKKKPHTTFAVESETGSVEYTVQYGDGV